MGRIKKSREERLKEIQDAATDVFLEKGFRQTTMEDIIARTSLSKGGFYHYYSDKMAIMLDIMQALNIRFFEMNLSIEPHWSKEEIADALTKSALVKILGDRKEKPLYIMYLMEVMMDHDLADRLLEYERHSLDIIGEKLNWTPDDLDDYKRLFISRLITGLFTVHVVFSQDNFFNNHQQLLYDLLYRIMYEAI